MRMTRASDANEAARAGALLERNAHSDNCRQAVRAPDIFTLQISYAIFGLFARLRRHDALRAASDTLLHLAI